MKKQHGSQAEPIITLRMWTYAEAVKALPYLRALVRSLREHWLHLQQVRLQVRRLDARPGRPDRQALILRAEAAREEEVAEARFNEARRELEALDVSCLDPAGGLALIPFRQGDALAWFVFDLFAPRGLEAWRYHTDSLETRRPLVESLDRRLVDAVFSSRSLDVPMPGAGRP
jgi:Uncharacterized conserved protein (DUF2203)